MVTLEEAFNGSTRQISLRRSDSEKVETYQVKIPRGVHEGQRIRLAGQGEAGASGGKSGDLFLRVRLARHPDFSVEGNDLIHEETLEPWQAALGDRNRSADPGRQTADENSRRDTGGQRFRLRDRGLPMPAAVAAIYTWSADRDPEKVDRSASGNCGTAAPRLARRPSHALSETSLGKLDKSTLPLRTRMKIALGTDHAGFRYKEKIKELLISLGHEVKDFGTYERRTGRLSAFHPPGRRSGRARRMRARHRSRRLRQWRSDGGEQGEWGSLRALLERGNGPLSREHNDANVFRWASG